MRKYDRTKKIKHLDYNYRITFYVGGLSMEEAINGSALLMLSGGRDSFYSACKLVAKGYYVYMITYDNGHMSRVDAAAEVGKRIENHFGRNKARYLGVYPIASRIGPLLEKIYNRSVVQLCSDYPHILVSQINCLACHTVMYWNSIALCKAMNIKVLSEGARKSQGFFVEQLEMRKRYEALCKEYDICLELPAFDLDSDQERKNVLADWGFLPKTCETQCWLGCPMSEPLSEDNIKDLARYYDNEVLPKAKEIIDLLIPVKENNIRQLDSGIIVHDFA